MVLNFLAELLGLDSSEQGERLCLGLVANGSAGFFIESFWLWNSKLEHTQTSSAMPAPTFGRIPPSLWDESKPPLKDSTACFNL